MGTSKLLMLLVRTIPIFCRRIGIKSLIFHGKRMSYFYSQFPNTRATYANASSHATRTPQGAP